MVSTTFGKTTAVKLKTAGKERDLTRVSPIEFLELTPTQVRECTEVHMGSIGLEKIRGFEPLIQLQTLWLNNNKLKHVNNLDANFRIKNFYGQYNEICSLKGSLNCMRYLETLDLSHNKLRDLDKLLIYLEKFNFLRTLNLKGNPCCEEPDYRLHVIHRMPSVHVLDQHVVTYQERFDARTQIGGDIAALTIAFGKRIPMPDEWIMAKVEDLTEMEKECKAEAAALRTQRAQDALDADFRAHEHDPHPPTVKKEYPPQPPGWMGAPLGSHLLPREDGTLKAKPATKHDYIQKDTFRHYSIDKASIVPSGHENGVAPTSDDAQLPQAGAKAPVPNGKATIRLHTNRVTGHIKRETDRAKPTVVTCSTIKL